MHSKIMLFPNGKLKALTLSYDDGVEQDIRLIEIMNKNGIKGTFNLNSGLFAVEGTVYPKGQIHRRLSQSRAVELYRDSGHEIAIHAVHHPFLEQLPLPEAMIETLDDRRSLENLFGVIIRGMAYPYGTYSDTVIEALRACGIVYSRTTKYTCDFSIPNDWLKLEATCHHNNPELMNLADKFINGNPARAPWLFYLWGHSYEFEADNNWELIEKFCKTVGGRDDIWYATNIEVYDYIQAYESLQFSAAGSRIYNPSATKVWLRIDNNDYCIASGETLLRK